jgi:hypothetical protein
MDSLHILANLISKKISPQAVEDNQWGHIVDTAYRHDLAPVLYWVLKDQAPNLKSNPRLIPLKQAANDTAAKLSLFETAREQIDSAMAVAGIPAIWLKGIALAHTVYPQPWLRPMVDIDVLVPFHQRERALTAANSAGFTAPEEPDVLDLDILPEELKRHYSLVGGPANAIILELHYKLLVTAGVELLSLEQLDWFWENTSRIFVGPNSFKIFNPEASLLYLCAHALLQHGAVGTSLMRIFDIHLSVIKEDLDWQLIVDKAIQFMWSYAVERGLNIAVDFFETPVPSWALDELNTRRSPGENTFQVTRFQGKGHRWERRMMELSNLSFAARLRVILKKLFPPKDFMLKRYAITPGRPVLPYYFYRWFDAARILFCSIRTRVANYIHRH